MNYLYFGLGVSLLIVAVTDLLWTTLWVEAGAGPLTARLMRGTWKLLRRVGTYSPRIRTLAGPVVLALGLGMWIALLWGGWMFVFASAENALRDTIDTGPISWAERFYFVGYSLFTMGNGDFAPRDGLWQILTALMTASGMLLVTLSITYVLSVLDAVTQKRSFAQDVSGLGLDGESIVTTTWNGSAFDDVALPLNSITTALNELTANHKAYPILHYFYTDDREAAAVLSGASLDDALTLWQQATPEEDRPGNSILKNARSSVQNYLDTVSTFATPSDEQPPSPDLAVLRDAGVPTVSNEEFDDALKDLETRRRTMYGVIRADARQWPGAWEE
ncbi:potassium channel family protein [Halalkalicoccus sp. NIPERK01]|uniref:potassium channel family protein n=1 Tax=Halalkalicoccus sp. NIPERK01 TaxID=3053469 RepID=UPI00256F3444|nr:potassium channel family protein [Halalkalicoccus sp. NIPERK01]MDL5363212.1 potassium channel family protein [Halalkalicoccus sp. NIPERK01]